MITKRTLFDASSDAARQSLQGRSKGLRNMVNDVV